MNITPYFFRKLGKVSQNLSSAAVVIGALRVEQSNTMCLPFIHVYKAIDELLLNL